MKMTINHFDLIYLLLVLTGILFLIENRLKRIIYWITLQAFLLIFPVFQVKELNDPHSWILVSMIIIFKGILTPYVMFWTLRKQKLSENTYPRFGYLATLFFFLIGFLITLIMVDNLKKIPEAIDKIELIYIFLLTYLGVLTFIVRTHWMALMGGFIMFENGIFLLTLVLQNGLPLGIEFGAFMDALLVIFSAVALQLRADSIHKYEEYE
jgi:hydrogenase-4 component E